MRAMTFERYGGPDVLALGEWPDPVPGRGEVLVAVHAAAVNPVDWKLASGAFRLLLPARFPAVPGMDLAGTVVALGPGVEGPALGTRVHARIDGPGACAELALARADLLVPVPASMGWAEAAALPLAGMTALQALHDACRLPLEGATQRVLVVGASGGVGHLAVQVAKVMGAHVTGVCSARNVSFVQGLGADAVIDYTAPDPYSGHGPFDAIVDCVSDNPGAFLPRLTPRGHYAAVLPGPRVIAHALLNLLGGRQAHPVMLRRRGADLRRLDAWWEAGRLRVAIDSTFDLPALPDAWRRSMTGRSVGKIAIRVRPDGVGPVTAAVH